MPESPEDTDKQALHLHLYQSIAGSMLGNPNGGLVDEPPEKAAEIIHSYYVAILSRFYKKATKTKNNHHGKDHSHNS